MSHAEMRDRRQRARNAAWDAVSGLCIGVEGTRMAIETTAEVATQVKITYDIKYAFIKEAYGSHEQVTASVAAGLIAAFRAAGFEVVE